MTPIDSSMLNRKPKELRDAVKRHGEVPLKYRGTTYAKVVALATLEAERTELEQLRERISELEKQLQKTREGGVAA